jgi:hypothetical protein
MPCIWGGAAAVCCLTLLPLSPRALPRPARPRTCIIITPNNPPVDRSNIYPRQRPAGPACSCRYVRAYACSGTGGSQPAGHAVRLKHPCVVLDRPRSRRLASARLWRLGDAARARAAIASRCMHASAAGSDSSCGLGRRTGRALSLATPTCINRIIRPTFVRVI